MNIRSSAESQAATESGTALNDSSVPSDQGFVSSIVQDDTPTAQILMIQKGEKSQQIKFLLINPASKAYSNLYQLRGESVPYESYGRFATMVDIFDNLKVHLYSHMPSFRMQFVDDSYLAISRYYFDKPAHDHWAGGWKIPHLIICNEQQEFDKSEVKHKGSLFGSFLLAYNSIWDNGIDIKQWDAEGKNFNK